MQKNVVIISDMHCGHMVGLTHSNWQLPQDVPNKTRNKFAKLQKMTYDWFKSEIKSIGKIDTLIINGDCVEGKGARSKGTELITADMHQQAEMAIDIIKMINGKKIFMTYGTPYHTGDGEDVEDIISKDVGADISGHQFININGVIFDVKHKVGGSSVPHGRFTAVQREAIWNELWASRKNGQPNADILIRSHVHYFTHSGNADKLCITTPALQGYGSKYGVRQCSGIVDVGFITFKIQDNGEYSWRPHILENALLKAELKKG